MAQFIVGVKYLPTKEVEEHRVSAADWVEAAFKVGLYVAFGSPEAYSTLDTDNRIVSVDRVHEERTREWDQA